GAAAPHQIPRSRLRPHQPLCRRLALERGRDPRLVHGREGKPVMLPSERLDFSAIGHRPKLVLPDGARMVVWVIVNVEEWDPTQPMPRTVLPPPAGGSPSPDVPNWAWHEYGNRVGFWRFTQIFDEFNIPVVLAINGSALAAYPPIVQAACERGWEFMGHG